MEFPHGVELQPFTYYHVYACLKVCANAFNTYLMSSVLIALYFTLRNRPESFTIEELLL